MRAAEVLDHQAELLDRLKGGHMRDIMAASLSSALSNRGRTMHPDPQTSEGMVDLCRNAVQAAYAYHVTADMSMLVQYAASQLDETDKFDRSLAPTPCGFARFDKPLPVTDVRGKQMLVHWMVWGPVQARDMGTSRNWAGIGTWFFNDHREPDEIAVAIMKKFDPEQLAKIGTWGFIGADFTADGHSIGPPWIPLNAEYTAQILAEGDIPHEFTSTTRYVHAFWLLMNQTITSRREETVDRATAKRARRMDLPGRVTVISLRRIAGMNREPGETLVEWSHRWVVRGHWRWQPYGDGTVRRIYIAPYIKGPESKPLVVTDKVYDLRR